MHETVTNKTRIIVHLHRTNTDDFVSAPMTKRELPSSDPPRVYHPYITVVTCLGAALGEVPKCKRRQGGTGAA